MDSLESKFDKVAYLQNILTSRATGGGADSHEFETLRKELTQDEEIRDLLPRWLRLHRDLDSFWSFIQPKFPTYAERRGFLSQEFTPVLDYLEFGEQSPAESLQGPAEQGSLQTIIGKTIVTPLSDSTKEAVTRNKRKVFIVHGRDNEVKQEVSRFIESLGLETIILHEQANSGMTIIEKIERYTNDADYALVLYTPCDQGRGHHEKKTHAAKDRARQNVVFEHGYLMAKLGRDNVCSLVKGDIETPNDISGVVYVNLDFGGAWKLEVAKELKACGYTIKELV